MPKFNDDCNCKELDADLACVLCRRHYYGCRYCPRLFFYPDTAAEHKELCTSRTVLDDIVEALETAGDSGLPGFDDPAATSVTFGGPAV